ncbi:hypothetical protein DIPPA_19484 [Diplonema papillatum]|nr:hypothetical protein DIPPA_19484 [Diplonema papillatum]
MTQLPDRKVLEDEVRHSVKQMREEGMKEIYQQRMLKLKAEAGRLGVFSDGIFPEFTPQQFVEVAWGTGDTENVALNGNKLPLDALQPKPSYMFEASDGILYCLVAFDWEAKTLLWCRFNIEGDTKFSTGRDWFRWQPPHPEKGTGTHRVFFFVFHQKEPQDLAKLKIISKFSREGRSGFDPKKFADKFNLKIVIGINCASTEHAEVADKFRLSLKDTADLQENEGKDSPIADPCS